MNSIIKSILLISILSIIAGHSCSDKSDKNEDLNQPPSVSTDCRYSKGFIETYRDVIEYDGVFFVKGVVTASGSYGKKIKIIEDIKGNFKGSASITLWNHWEFGVADSNYELNDIMLILMTKIGDDFGDSDNSDPWTKQRIDDYCTIGCSVSTLLLSDEYASGTINTRSEKISVSWKDLQERLHPSCQSDIEFVENYHANIKKDDVFFIKGTVVDERCSYWIKIKPIKDLKGNFPNESTIVVWGKGDLSNSIDPIHIYNTDQTPCGAYSLYMLIKPIVPNDVPYSDRTIGDYATIDCAFSIVPINLIEQCLGNGEFVGVGGEWMTSEEFEEKFNIK